MKILLFIFLILFSSGNLFSDILPYDKDIGQVAGSEEMEKESILRISREAVSQSFDDEWLEKYIEEENHKLIILSYGNALFDFLPVKKPIFSVGEDYVKVKDLENGKVLTLFFHTKDKIALLALL